MAKLRTDRRIDKVMFVKMPETSPDLSFLGEYSSTPGPICIDRLDRGDMGRGEYRYFNLGIGDAAYIEHDYKRMEAYNRGDWCMVNVYAEADIVVSGVCQKITSGGLGNVESDAGYYFEILRKEELATLGRILLELEFPKHAVLKALKKCEDVER